MRRTQNSSACPFQRGFSCTFRVFLPGSDERWCVVRATRQEPRHANSIVAVAPSSLTADVGNGRKIETSSLTTSRPYLLASLRAWSLCSNCEWALRWYRSSCGLHPNDVCRKDCPTLPRVTPALFYDCSFARVGCKGVLIRVFRFGETQVSPFLVFFFQFRPLSRG